MEFDSSIKRINDTYLLNLEEVEKSLLGIGINIRVNEKEYKSLPQVLDEISKQWNSLSTEENKIKKSFICRVIAGIRDMNFLNLIIDKLSHKKR